MRPDKEGLLRVPMWTLQDGHHKRPVLHCIPGLTVGSHQHPSNAPRVAADRWYKYGRRQRRAIVAYTIFGTLAVIILSAVIGAVAYGLQAKPSPMLGEFRAFQAGFLVTPGPGAWW